MKSLRWLSACVPALVLLGCGSPPKPRELESFEHIRTDPKTRSAAEVAPDLIAQADHLMVDARNHWESNELEESRQLALLGEAKVKHAIALSEQRDAEARIKKGHVELDAAATEIDKLERELDATKENLGLLQRIEREKREQVRLQGEIERQKHSAEEENHRLSEQLQGEKSRSDAAEKVKAAEALLKEAESMNAPVHAAEAFEAAKVLIARARTELGANQLDAARATADLGRQKAASAIEQAKPIFDKGANDAARVAKAESLNREAAALPMVEVRRESRGSLQRVVIHIPAALLFRSAKDTALAAGSEGVLLGVAQLIKRYEEFPVQVVGHTDSRGRQDAMLARSLARAYAVQMMLLSNGVSANRITVLGRGSDEPLTDNRTNSGRQRNSRVEIVFMYQ